MKCQNTTPPHLAFVDISPFGWRFSQRYSVAVGHIPLTVIVALRSADTENSQQT